MKHHTKNIFIIVAIILFVSCAKNKETPKPILPIPSERQLNWHQLEYYAFVHFNMNTFTDMEWGLGGELPETFNPTQFDAKQWAATVKNAGMKGIIITAKHHDGFCLWPTKTTEHSIKNSPYKNGNGDIVKEVADACKEYGLKFGVYLSPWDRNNEHYGKPEYVDIFHEQLRELLTNYGEVFEVWFDGANGGSGYYGGANETRKIDNKTYYEWEKVTAMVRELQPNAVIFSDGGPDIRWVGNEEGWANKTNWSIMRRDEIYPGWPRYIELRSGHEDGTHWLPAECDVSIRPGWYYHASEDHQVKSLEHLIDIYYKSVGRNASLLLNIPVDKRGLIHEKDSTQLMTLRKQLDKDFQLNVAVNAQVEATNIRKNNSAYKANLVVDNNAETYWATDDEVTSASITLSLDKKQPLNRIVLQEYIPLGQRVIKFKVEAEIDGQWKLIDEQTTVGYKRILRFDRVETSKIKVTISASRGPILLSNIELYNAPNLLVSPQIVRNKEGMVTIKIPDDKVKIYYTTDGTEPSEKTTLYKEPFLVAEPILLKVIAVNPPTGEKTDVLIEKLEAAKKDWNITKVSSGQLNESEKIVDANPETFWSTDENDTQRTVQIDLGKLTTINGFTYTPMQARSLFGLITHYSFSVSKDGKNWSPVSKGEFGNIVNNRIKQEVQFDTVEARFIKLKAEKVAGEDQRASFAEIGILKD